MQDCTARPPEAPAASAGDVLTEVLRAGAQQLLPQAVEAKVDAWLQEHGGGRPAKGRKAQHGTRGVRRDALNNPPTRNSSATFCEPQSTTLPAVVSSGARGARR